MNMLKLDLALEFDDSRPESSIPNQNVRRLHPTAGFQARIRERSMRELHVPRGSNKNLYKDP